MALLQLKTNSKYLLQFPSFKKTLDNKKIVNKTTDLRTVSFSFIRATHLLLCLLHFRQKQI